MTSLRRSLLLVALIANSRTAIAQQTTGAMQGRVRAASGPVAGAQVTVTSTDLLGVRRAASASDGIYQLRSLPPGTYTIRVAAIGYTPAVLTNVRVQLGATTAATDLVLDRTAVQLDEVTIRGGLSIDPEHTAMGTTITAGEHAALPGGRDYTSVLTIVPHANRSHRGDPVNVAGSTGLENMYFIDGVNVTAPVRAETGTRLPYNFIRSVEVKTGGYEAQYGKALGAVVNAITYSGTNDFELSFFGFTSGSALSAAPKAEPTLRETNALSYDVGVRVGGPIVRDRLWYSAAVNPRLDRADREVLGAGVFRDEQTTRIFASKLTWAVGPSVSAELSMFGDPTERNAVMVPAGWIEASYTPTSSDPYRVRIEEGGVVSSLRVSANAGTRVMLDGSVSRMSNKRRLSSAVPGAPPLYRDQVTFAVSGGWPEYDDSRVGRTSTALRATALLGRHTVVAGIEYENNRTSGANGQRDIARTAANSWFETVGHWPQATLHNRVPTEYLQDSWRILDRLTLNAGLRLSTQTLSAARGLTGQRFLNEWQPRLGFVWRPGTDDKQRVFGSAGRFYEQEPLWLSGGFADNVFGFHFYSTDPRLGGAPDSSVVDSSFFQESFKFANVPDIEVENFNELTIGYERIAGRSKLTARAVRRDLRSSYQFGYNYLATPTFPQGTPGTGFFSFLPRPKRQYTALELSAEGGLRRGTYRASYVLSRNWGNYTGLFDADLGIATPGGNRTFFAPNQAVNSTGHLPNDHTHVVKLSGSTPVRGGLSTGFTFDWASGSPINAFAPCPCGNGTDIIARTFVVPRGSAGRMPATTAFDVRLAYDIRPGRAARARLLLDLLDVGNLQTAVVREELKFRNNSGGVPSDLNPNYLRPTAFQRPMRAHLGMEVVF